MRTSSLNSLSAITHPIAKLLQITIHSRTRSKSVSEYQTRVYTLLQQIPSGRVTTYGALAAALNSSPRAVGFAPEVLCHRCIASSGFVGGFKGDWENAPSGQNQSSKLKFLEEEGVRFDGEGVLLDQKLRWDAFDTGRL
ncbi:6-O-methylguanine DNA methyltransferase [Phyllosticta citriasiana]|uniref:Methylated-DNA--protein-cysteine methyltransferase n=1 Tax=Phyllosticta citriasiana TaxID=595635 RepID=A0ABR1KAD2_9PEZI